MPRSRSEIRLVQLQTNFCRRSLGPALEQLLGLPGAFANEQSRAVQSGKERQQLPAGEAPRRRTALAGFLNFGQSGPSVELLQREILLAGQLEMPPGERILEFASRSTRRRRTAGTRCPAACAAAARALSAERATLR